MIRARPSATPVSLLPFRHRCPPEVPSLRRHYPVSPVIRASPPPCTARPDPRGLSVGACHATARASRVASIPLFHACRRHYPSGIGRCLRRSLPDPCQPSSSIGRVGFRIRTLTEITLPRPRRAKQRKRGCALMKLANLYRSLSLIVSRPARRSLALPPAWSLGRPRRPFVIRVLQPMSLPPSSAPTATGWSDSCRAGFAPAEEWRLRTAHQLIGIWPSATSMCSL